MNFTDRKQFWIFQILLHVIVFIFYAVERNQTGIEGYKYAFFANYAIAAALINFIALPSFYKNKNIIRLIIAACIFIIAAVIIEEMILEHIFFEGRRADSIQALWAFISIVPVVAILTGFKFGWDAYIKQKELERLESLVRESEMQFLKSQINPHFLFNNLNNIYSYALEGSEKTPGIILELSNLLRYMLYDCKDPFVSLAKEIEHLKSFISLSQLQIENRGNVKLNIQSADYSYQIAPLILIVFIENAFKHSQSGKSDNIEIEVDLSCSEKGILNFSCRNNYDAITNTKNLSQGIGLNNVKKRLEHRYGQLHTLDIKTTDKTYEVNLNIDLSKSRSE